MGTLSLLLRLLTLAILLGLLGLWLAKRPAFQALQEEATRGREQLDLPAETRIPEVLRGSLADLRETRARLARREEAADRLEAETRTLRRDLGVAETEARSLRQELRAAREGLAEARRRAESSASRTEEIAAALEDERRSQISLNQAIGRLREELLAAQRETADLRARLDPEEGPDPGRAVAAGAGSRPSPVDEPGVPVEIARVDAERGLIVFERSPGPPLPSGSLLTLRDGDEAVARLRLRRSHPRFLLLEFPPEADRSLRLREGSVLTLQP